MAGTTHYKFTTVDMSGTSWTVKIKDTTYLGSTEKDFTGAATGPSISWEDAGDDIYQPIIASEFECSIDLSVDSLSLFDAIIAGPDCRFIVLVYKGAALYWRGFVSQFSMSKPDAGNGTDAISITATDGFGLLSDIIYSGYDINALTRYNYPNWLAKIGAYLPLNYDAVNTNVFALASVWYEDSQENSVVTNPEFSNPLASTYVNESAFLQVDEYNVVKASNLYDILTELLSVKRLQISQCNGVFLLIQANTYAQTSTRAWYYDKAATFQSTSSLSLQLTMPVRLTGGTFNYVLPAKEVTAEYKYRQGIYRNNLLPYNVDHNTLFTLGLSIQNAGITFNGRIETIYNGSGGDPIMIQAVYKLLIKNGSKYLNQNASGELEWTTDSSNYVPVKTRDFKSDYAGVQTMLKDFAISTILPEEGETITFKWQYYRLENFGEGTLFDDSKVTYTLAHDDIEGTFIARIDAGIAMDGKQFFRASISNSARADIKLDSVGLGDGPNKYSAGALFVRNIAGDIVEANAWTIYSGIGGTAYPINSLRCMETLALSRNTIEVYNGIFDGSPDFHKGFVFDGKYFCFKSISWDSLAGEYSFSAFVVAPDRTGIVVAAVLTAQDEQASSTSSGSGSNGTNTETQTHNRLHNLFDINDHSGSGGTAKTTIVDADSVVIIDSEDGSRIKRSLWSTVKSYMQTYLEPIWQLFTNQRFIDINRFGFLNQTETTISFDPATYIFTLGSVGTSWSYYRAGLKYTINGSKIVTLSGTPPTTGNYYIYIDDTNGSLTVGPAWTLNDTKVPVAFIYFNNNLTPKYQLSDERHSCLIDRRMHLYEHITSGTKYISGGALAGYTLNNDSDAAKTFSISEAVIADEDILLTLSALSDPNGAMNAYVVVYKSGGAYVWEDAQVPFRYTTSGYIQYNSAGTMTEGANGKYYNTYLFLSNIVGSARFIIIHGESEFSTASTAYAEVFSAFNLSGFITNEGFALYQLTWSTLDSYSSKGKCVLNRVQRISTNIVSTSQSTVDIPWDIKIDSAGALPIYHTASLNTYKGLNLITGSNMLITYASGADGFLNVTLASTGGGSGVSSFNTRTGVVTLSKADVEAVLTGAITSHTHAYDNYQYWKVAWYNAGTDGNEYFNIASTKSFKITPGDGIVMSQPTVSGDITSQVISAEVTSNNSVRKLASFYADAANSGTGVTTAYTYTLPANRLSVNGQFLEIDFYGEAANNTNTKTIQVTFGGVTLALMQNSQASALTRWHISYKIIRVSSTQLRVSQNLTWNFSTQCDTQDSTVNLSNSNVINLTLQGGASSDLIAKSATITIYP